MSTAGDPQDRTHQALLQAIVETARAIFSARAASVFLLDDETHELVFVAVAGEGSSELVGKRFPAATGIAGSALTMEEPLIVDDVAQDPRFGRDAAESTGYVPGTLMAVPLAGAGRPLGVLEVLDRGDRSRSPLEELGLLELFGRQAAMGLELLVQARQAGGDTALDADEAALLAEIGILVGRLGGERRESAGQLLAAVRTLLGP